MTMTQFAPVFHDGTKGHAMDAEVIEYGLVIHTGLDLYGCPSLSEGMTISDPITGFRVAGGDSREQALFNLHVFVCRMGGPAVFPTKLAERRAEIAAMREECAARLEEMRVAMAEIRSVMRDDEEDHTA
ncbi:hypothetical protein CEW87_04095 [Parazoarcus communis]|uniref:Uncharacterized protein n=1 Tax=Parazoarcus communis TaxID=41977 RepID=A0A2U8GYU2_9RHOO|nr:hypothetical protein [Parazoarcus communis]AWI78614.1 hypothetical protein CEW87_04095 [Parazoarcus communis]